MRKFTYVLGLLLLVAAPILAKPVYADGASIYLTPSVNTFSKGDLVTLQVRENSGSAQVNAVQANLNYDASKLTFAGFVSNDSFSVQAENYAYNGLIRVARGAFSPVTGDQEVVGLQFVAAENGSATVNFTDNTVVVGVLTVTNLLTSNGSGGTYQIQSVSLESGNSYTISVVAHGTASAPVSDQTEEAVVEQDIDLVQLLTNPVDYPAHVF